jgi:hypothetical protein
LTFAISGALGPQSAKHAQREVTSLSRTEPSSGRWLRIQLASWLANAVPVTIWNTCSSTRVTVKSHSIPPRRVSLCG